MSAKALEVADFVWELAAAVNDADQSYEERLAIRNALAKRIDAIVEPKDTKAAFIANMREFADSIPTGNNAEAWVTIALNGMEAPPPPDGEREPFEPKGSDGARTAEKSQATLFNDLAVMWRDIAEQAASPSQSDYEKDCADIAEHFKNAANIIAPLEAATPPPAALDEARRLIADIHAEICEDDITPVTFARLNAWLTAYPEGKA